MNYKSAPQIRDTLLAGIAAKQQPVVFDCTSQWEQQIVYNNLCNAEEVEHVGRSDLELGPPFQVLAYIASDERRIDRG